MRRLSLLLLGLGLLLGAASVFQSRESEATPYAGNAHWAYDGTPLRLGFTVVGGDEQLVADVLDAWNETPEMDLGTIGPGDPTHCAVDETYRPSFNLAVLGIVEICVVPQLYVIGVALPAIQQQLDGQMHIVGARVFIRASAGASFRLFCEEIGHALGINHPAPTDGCIEGSSGSLCPSQQEINELSALYSGHNDGYTVPDPGVYTLVGNAPCTTVPLPTSTPTPAPTKVPFCVAHPEHRKCR